MTEAEIIAAMLGPYPPVVLQFPPGSRILRADIASPRPSGPDADDVVRSICRATGLLPFQLSFERDGVHPLVRCWVLDQGAQRRCRITCSPGHVIGMTNFEIAARCLARADWRPPSPSATQGADAA